MRQPVTKALLALIFALPIHAQTGLGKSTYTCIDKDGDGYGVGPGCVGPDADDNDAAVFSGPQAIAKYGTMRNFLMHLGYNPRHIFYLSTTGNDSTGIMDDPTHPYQTWAKMNTLLGNGTFGVGDMLMFRGGTWTNTTLRPFSGQAGSPVILMAYPGEAAWFDNHATGAPIVSLPDQSYIIVDGLKVTGGLTVGSGCITGSSADARTSSTFHDNIFRNIEATGCGQGLDFMNGLTNLTIEDNLIHGSSAGGQHCIYIGSRGLPSSNVKVQRNICYNAAWNGFHINGRFTNLQVDQNIIYTVGIAGFSLQEGVSNSFFRNNLIFNTSSAAIEISNYPGDCALFGQGGTGAICPYDQTGNLFENNTAYQTGYNGAGNVTQFPAVKVINYSVNQAGDLGHQTWRNNIFVGYGGAGHYPAVVYTDANKPYLSTSVFANNVFWSLDGALTNTVVGWGTSSSWGYQGYTCSQAGAVTSMSGCINADPKFVKAGSALHSTPTLYNFGLLAGSAAIGTGTATGIPATDIVGTLRGSQPTVGAYEANSGTPGSTLNLSAVSCNPATLNSTGMSTCTVTLSQPAGSGGVSVKLSSNSPILTVPAVVTVLPGVSSAIFTATTATISINLTATVTATLDGVSQIASVSLLASTTGGGTGPGGWLELTNTHLQDVCPPRNYQPPGGGMPAYDFFSNCYNVIAADSGAAADTKRNRLIIWGGGHAGYAGNELYSLDLNTSPPTLVRLNNPSIFDPLNGNLEVNASDGTPTSRHTYGGLVYLPVQDKIFAWEGVSLGGRSLRQTWQLDMNTLTWTNMHPELTPGSFDVTAGGGSASGAECAYDPNTQKVLCEWGGNLLLVQYDPATNKWAMLTSHNLCSGFPTCVSTAAISAVIDPAHKYMILIGNSNASNPSTGTLIVWAIDISSGGTYAAQDWSSQVKGCSSLNVDYPGLVYDPVVNRIVAYPNDGDFVYIFDPVSKTCTPQGFPNGPPASGLTPPNGTFGRFAYFPSIGKYALVNRAGNNAFTLTLTGPSSSPSCDINTDSLVNVVDVQGMINQALGVTACTTGALQKVGQCSVVDVQRVIVAALGGTCKIGL